MKYIIVLLVMCLPQFLVAQNEATVQVEKAIEDLFNGMRAGDSSLVRSVFYKDASMQTTVLNQDGTEGFTEGSLDRFLNAVGTPHDAVWDEQIKNLKIDIDDNLAQAWMDYSFYAGDKFSHCGVNAMQLVKLDGKWKIVNIIDTRRKAGCK